LTAARGGCTLVVDCDGTVTEQDLLDTIAQTFGDEDVYREVDEGLDNDSLTLHEVIRREFEPVRTPLEQVREWVLENVRVRPGFHEVVALANERGWRFVIVSSGFRELIEPVLEREGIAGVEVLSNTVNPDPEGWKVQFRVSEVCEVCGQPCKRSTAAAVADGTELVYVGDGYSDRCAAESADLVFARRGLASYLEERGVPFERFEDFNSIARRLAS
jgi:2-hydroxy-3-keto-5-methylthiopentenyl-1-phosphate phosphatase